MIDKIKTIEELNNLEISNAGIIPFSFLDGELYFLFGREAKDIKSEDRSLWGDFGGKIKKEKENNLEGMIREFWEGSNGVLGENENITNYINSNFEKLLVVHSKEYKGVILFLPITYDKKIEKIFSSTTKLIKHVLDKKTEIQKTKQRGLMEKDMIQWFSMNELLKLKKRFRQKNQEILQIINIVFTPNL